MGVSSQMADHGSEHTCTRGTRPGETMEKQIELTGRAATEADEARAEHTGPTTLIPDIEHNSNSSLRSAERSDHNHEAVADSRRQATRDEDRDQPRTKTLDIDCFEPRPLEDDTDNDQPEEEAEKRRDERARDNAIRRDRHAARAPYAYDFHIKAGQGVDYLGGAWRVIQLEGNKSSPGQATIMRKGGSKEKIVMVGDLRPAATPRAAKFLPGQGLTINGEDFVIFTDKVCCCTKGPPSSILNYHFWFKYKCLNLPRCTSILVHPYGCTCLNILVDPSCLNNVVVVQRVLHPQTLLRMEVIYI